MKSESIMSEMKTKLPYTVPEGYFDSLKERLSAIPAGQVESGFEVKRSESGRRFSRYAVALTALAACLVAGIFIGKNLQKDNSGYTAENEMIIEYLVESGTTLSQIENCL